jgi:hypothetical protein
LINQGLGIVFEGGEAIHSISLQSVTTDDNLALIVGIQHPLTSLVGKCQ